MTRQIELNVAAEKIQNAITALDQARNHLNTAAFPGRYSMRLLIADLRRLRDLVSDASVEPPTAVH